MSVASEINRIKANIADAYDEAEAKGATMPATENSANLADTIASITAGVPIDTKTYDQRNGKTSEYLSEVTYDPSDYSTSSVSTYASATTSYNKSRPSGIVIAIPESGTLTVTDGSRSLSYGVSAGNHTVYNITPGTSGTYIFRNSNGEIKATGTLNPTGALRMIYAENLVNVRDLGGWSCDGGTVKYGKLFRGCELTGSALPSAQINNFGKKVMNDLIGIDYECDLRWDNEIYGQDGIPDTADDIKSSALGDHVEYRRFPIQYYLGGVNLSSKDSELTKACLLFVMERVIRGEVGYFHCMYGRDRTGTLACILLALLGVSQSDIDKDYELTSMAGFEAYRNGSGWSGLVSYFNTFSGNTFRDKVANWAVQLGIPVQTLNDYRAAIIDGTPSAISPSVSTFTVSNTLAHATSDNVSTSATQYQPYVADITPDKDYLLGNIVVTMGGVDITDKVFSGQKTFLRRSVNTSLSNCTIDNDKISAVDGEGYGATITPDTGYSLDGATIIITMGGIDVSNYYSSGKIAIPRVTGNISISITAVPSAPSYTNKVPTSIDTDGTIFNGTGYADGYRLNSSGTTTALTQSTATGYIAVNPGDVIRFKGVAWNADESGSDRYSCYFHECDSSFSSVAYKRADVYSMQNEIGDVYKYTVSANNAAYIRLNGIGRGTNLIVTVNEEIV